MDKRETGKEDSDGRCDGKLCSRGVLAEYRGEGEEEELLWRRRWMGDMESGLETTKRK